MASAGRFFEALFDPTTSQLQKLKPYRIYTDAGATLEATLYNDKTKAQTVTQPRQTSASGMAEFYAVPGEYYLKIGTSPVVKVMVYEDPADTADEDANYITTADADTLATTTLDAAKEYADSLAEASAVGGDVWLIGHVNDVAYTSITRDGNDAVTSASVVWPDGTTGTFTADTLSVAFPGAVDAYHVTYEGDSTRTITQALVTRNGNGAVTAQPELEVS